MSIDSTEVHSAVERAAALGDLSRWAEAAQLLASALAGDPQNYRALCLLSLARLNLGAYEDSVHAAAAASSAAPDQEWAYRLASISLSKLGRHDEAIAMARRSVALAPHQSTTYRALAQTLVAARRNLDEARAVAEWGLALAPTSPDAHVSVGNVAAADGRRADAEAAFQRALALDPDNTSAHNELARLHLGRRRFGSPGHLALAAGGFATAVRADPRAQTSRRNLDLVVHLFLARTAYLIFVVAFIASKLTDSSTSTSTSPVVRAVPALLLIVPAWYAVRFLSRLTPPLRRMVGDAVRRPGILIAIVCDLLAVLALVVGAVSRSADAVVFPSAAALGLIARLTLWSTRQRQVAARDGKRFYVLGSRTVGFIVVALIVGAAFCVLGCLSSPNAADILVPLAVALVALALVLVWRIRKRAATRP